jgi:hypothetical protein
VPQAMITKDSAYQNITQLVERFDEQKESYKKNHYNEALVRRDFIDPFFKSLGWDIDNSQGYAEAYREVIHEDRVKIGSATKAPDYSFRLPGGKRLFFVEAKKPSVLVKNEILPAYQVRRYAWSAKLPVSILTDFEEFAVYDCNKKPKPDDKASTGRIKYLTYGDYLKEFDFIWDTFSKERVLKGSFDKFVASDVGKKGTTTVDKDFLASLDEWRIQLAQNIALRNPAFNEDELNYAVQQTIDRIIFLRIAEDRGVEEYGRLKTTLKGDNYYHNLFTVFKEADEKYNSGLFDFKKDKLSKQLQLDNKVLKGIFNELYYPVSPYEFSVLSVEILGSAYEQFLGKQIKLTDKHKASIEEKPEVRKAGGVYYTPQYIVDYIVEQTVGKLVEGKKPADVEKIKIVDPACGSGSFLIGAYQRLLTWYQNYYKPKFEELSAIAGSNEYNSKQRNDAVKERNKLPLTPDGALTSALKKQILLNNIYGVDIDTQAVEVTKLSLLLKCMEGETQSSMAAEMRFGERILPTLDNNIKSGNSLIDLDFYDGEFDFTPGAEKKIKPFSWEKAFPEVFKGGGFDVVIGNPPYIQSREAQLNELEKGYYYKHFETSENQLNTYGLFLEKGIKILKQRGVLGMIIPNYWIATKNDEKLRDYLFKSNSTKEILNVYRVFENAIVDTVTIVIAKGRSLFENKVGIKSIDRDLTRISERLQAIANKEWKLEKEIKVDGDNVVISFQDDFSLAGSKTIGDYFNLKFGVKLYQVGKGKPPQTKRESESKVFEAQHKMSKDYYKLLRARNIQRYLIREENYWIKYGSHLAEPRNLELFQGMRILIQRIVSKECLDACLTEETLVCNTDVITLKPKTDIDCKVILAILSSKLAGKYIKSKNVNLDREAFPKINTKTLESFPTPDFSKSDNVIIKKIDPLVDAMIGLKKEKQQTTLPEKLESLQHRINYTDDKINQLVYQLYGLTEEEVKIVEGV